jgi:hypothetical protein
VQNRKPQKSTANKGLNNPNSINASKQLQMHDPESERKYTAAARVQGGV